MIGLGTIAILLLTGCGSTYEPVIPKVKRLVKVDGNVYHIPRSTYQYHKIKKKFVVKDFKNAGGTCHLGDLEWYTKKGFNLVGKATNATASAGSDKQFEIAYNKYKTTMKHIVSSKNGGCVSPLTAKQKKAYKAERARQLNMINAQLNYMAYKKQRRSSNRNRNRNRNLSLNEYEDTSDFEKQDTGYVSYTGQKYKYDLSKPIDRINYSIDPEAQINDKINPNPMIGIDRSLGQYGGGAYGN